MKYNPYYSMWSITIVLLLYIVFCIPIKVDPWMEIVIHNGKWVLFTTIIYIGIHYENIVEPKGSGAIPISVIVGIMAITPYILLVIGIGMTYTNAPWNALDVIAQLLLIAISVLGLVKAGMIMMFWSRLMFRGTYD